MAAAATDRRVLCPIDFSEPSRRALRYATAFAARTNGQLSVLYVNDPLLSTAAAAAGYDQRTLASQTEKELRRFVRTTLDGALDRERVAYTMATGVPHRMIGRAVREFRADVIVMGTHGLTGARKVMLGSTTERVLRESKVPVLAIPHRAPRRPKGSWPAGPLVAAIDLGPEARYDVRAIAALAHRFGSDLLLVHVAPEIETPFWFKRRTGNITDLDRARGKLARLAAAAAATDVDVSFRVVRGDTAASLARIARRNKAGTLVLVLRRGKGIFGMARGTVTYRVLTTAVTPVIALPAGRGAVQQTFAASP